MCSVSSRSILMIFCSPSGGMLGRGDGGGGGEGGAGGDGGGRGGAGGDGGDGGELGGGAGGEGGGGTAGGAGGGLRRSNMRHIPFCRACGMGAFSSSPNARPFSGPIACIASVNMRLAASSRSSSRVSLVALWNSALCARALSSSSRRIRSANSSSQSSVVRAAHPCES